jgi:MFS transporter, DHA1 family, tetracycline resistance protein
MEISRSNRQASLFFIFATVAIDSIGLGIVLPVLPDVIRRFIQDEATVSVTYGYFVALYALMQFLSSPLLGKLSDKWGRRPILLCSLFGAAVDYLFMAFAPTLPLLFLGRMISGVSGASFTVAGAYIADISNDENRSKNFGMIGAGFGLGFIVGPAIGGFLASYGAHYAFIVAAIFNFLNFLFGLFILPESLAPENRREFGMKDLNPFLALKSVFAIPSIFLLVWIHILLQLAGQTHPSIWTLYTEHRFQWTPAQVGMSFAAVGVLSAFSQGYLTGAVVKKFGERKVLWFGVLGEAICFTLFGLATNGAHLYIILFISSFFWVSAPALQSLTSREVAPSAQGELQGSLMGLTSLTAIINPILMTWLFAATSKRDQGFYLPGSPYFLSGACIFLAFLLVIRWEKKTAL